MEGRGTYTWASGASYIGFFLFLKFSQSNMCDSVVGPNRYSGDWMNGRMHGTGCFVMKSGDKNQVFRARSQSQIV